jgi:hypothetical protein
MFGAFAASAACICTAQVDVRVEPTHLQGPRVLEEQTQTTVVQNYLQAWESMRNAFDRNDSSLLDRDFSGTARDKLGEAILQQAQTGIHTRYQDKSHDIRIVFYSPEGLSVELTDDVQYDVQMLDHDKTLTTQQVRVHYIVVLTPAEVRWRVRVLQAQFD